MKPSIRLIPVLALAVFALPGCGGEKLVEVKGKVTFQGKDVCGGGIQLVAKNNKVYGGELGEDGTFLVSGVPAGEVKIGVNSPDPSSSAATGMRAARKGPASLGAPKKAEAGAPRNAKWFPIPDKFADPDKSGVTGVASDQPLNVELK